MLKIPTQILTKESWRPMSKTTLIIIRHGFSEANEQNVFAGSYNIHLTETGKKQAQLTAEYLADTPIDKIYSSDLFRAEETAAPIAAQKNLPIERRASLREIYGGEWEGKPYFALIEKYKEDFSVWMDNFALARCTGGESIREMYARATAAIREILAENIGKTVCVVSHATVIRALITYFSNIPFEEINRVPFVPNSSVTTVEIEDGRFNVLKKGFADHLGKLTTVLPSKA